jgi:two-component system sensor histidine kinase PilS (NtrC family)
MPGAPRDPGLYRKLVWLTLFRMVIITVLLGGTAVVTWQRGLEELQANAPLFTLILVAYLASAGFAMALRGRSALVPIAYGQVALDVGVVAGLVLRTGRSESVFVFLFSLASVSGAILLFRRGALSATALSVAAYLAVALSGSERVALATVLVHTCAFVATAVLATYLAEQLRDTGERLAARESDLANITALHEAIVQSMNGGLLTLDPGGRITFLNRGGELMTGMELGHLRGRAAQEAFPMFGERVARDEIDFVNARGERLRLGYSSFPLAGRGGTVLGTAVIFQDLTQLRAMQEAVESAQRLADLGRLAAGLAHELRNPLASLSASIELLREPAGQEERRLIDIALRETERLNALVTDFLRFARPPPVRRARVELGAVLAETLDAFTCDPVAAGLRLERDLQPAVLDCDADQVRQVAWNLLLNAAQAVAEREGGRVRVTCAPLAGGGARFEVEDDGPGIPAEERARIFLPFHSTKPGGTGLGLATVLRIVAAHEGRVAVESKPGDGARFSVVLPAGHDVLPRTG